MLKRFLNRSRRKQFRIIVRKLPGALARRYGADDFYTCGQVRATAKVVKIRDRYVSFALAALCSEQDYLSADSEHEKWAYRERRELLAEETDLDETILRGTKLVSIYASNQFEAGNSGHESLPGTPGFSDSSD